MAPLIELVHVRHLEADVVEALLVGRDQLQLVVLSVGGQVRDLVGLDRRGQAEGVDDLSGRGLDIGDPGGYVSDVHPISPLEWRGARLPSPSLTYPRTWRCSAVRGHPSPSEEQFRHNT